MLRTLWGSLRVLFAILGLETDPVDLASGDADLGKTIDPNG